MYRLSFLLTDLLHKVIQLYFKLCFGKAFLWVSCASSQRCVRQSLCKGLPCRKPVGFPAHTVASGSALWKCGFLSVIALLEDLGLLGYVHK